MGKLSDAFDRQKQERSIRTNPLATEKPADSETKKRSGRAEQTETGMVGDSLVSGPEADIARLRINDPERSRIEEATLGRKFSPKLVVLSSPDSVDAENFKVLRAKVQLNGHKDNPPRALMVTSTYPGEGKSFVACNLAASMALGVDEHVLLVDCDLRRQNVHRYFGYAPSLGLSDYLEGRAEISDILIKTSIPKLTLLLGGTRPRNPAELVSSKRMVNLVDELRDRYSDRYVILDCTPMQFTSDANVISRHVDGIILVVMANRSPMKAVKNGVDNLDRNKILGVVFNGHDEPVKSYRRYCSGYYNA